ncbi:hypothetical protein M514_07339 [Trichuris suis]|uniref:BED-type domain-containing protein n=1 Tax=Trichuris suis TaxID=68888 RepID=A0A085NFV8_9BILA|nr:hypothetical protein M513_07339 [Trichuris suis]KFD68354.1 hypothetical protein M514_07339 [Trichuris suis]KHJ47738.1 hypothetical protein D918_01895 [Trichuris suis]
MSGRALRSSTRPLASGARVRKRYFSTKTGKVRRHLDSFVPYWRKYVEWSADHLHATCKMCNKTLCTPGGSAFPLKRHFLSKNHPKPKEATSKKRSNVARAKVKGAVGQKRKGRYCPVIPAALKKNKGSQAGSSVRAEKRVPETLESGNATNSSCTSPLTREDHNNVVAAENAKSKSPVDGEAPERNATEEDNRLVINTNGSSNGPFANCRPCKLTDEELATVCSFEWQLHGKRSLDGEWVTCEWCTEAFPLLEESPLDEFKKHLTNWHNIQFLNGWNESTVNEIAPERNLALDGQYLFCDVCSSAIFVTFADFEKHMNEHHGIY